MCNSFFLFIKRHVELYIIFVHKFKKIKKGLDTDETLSWFSFSKISVDSTKGIQYHSISLVQRSNWITYNKYTLSQIKKVHTVLLTYHNLQGRRALDKNLVDSNVTVNRKIFSRFSVHYERTDSILWRLIQSIQQYMHFSHQKYNHPKWKTHMRFGHEEIETICVCNFVFKKYLRGK